MMMNTTLEQLRGLRLHGMASGLQEQMAAGGGTHSLSFEERLDAVTEFGILTACGFEIRRPLRRRG